MRGDFLEDVRVFLEQEFEGAYPLRIIGKNVVGHAGGSP